MSIFDSQVELRPKAMATVAERRFDDAQALRDTDENARANGVAYLVGFVVEILLKARLVDKYASIAKKRQHLLAESEREPWSLIWRSHDLEAMLAEMPELEAALARKGQRSGTDYLGHLKKICATWTIQARYSAQSMMMSEAAQLLERVRSLKEELK
jgi:hypothetical protein